MYSISGLWSSVSSLCSYPFSSCYTCRSKKQVVSEQSKEPIPPLAEATQQSEPGAQIAASAPEEQIQEKPYAPYGDRAELPSITNQDLQSQFHAGTLRLEGKLLSREVLETIVKLDVHSLELRGCALDKNADFATLGYARNLQTLVVTDDIFTDDNIGTLTLFKKLEHLHIARSEHLTEATLEDIYRFAKGLKLLTLREMALTPAICAGIAKLPALTSLSLSYCTDITPEVMEPLSSSRSLQALTCTKCETIDDETTAVISSIRTLQRLDIIDAPITTKGLTKISSMNLSHLSIAECAKINDVAIRTLSQMKTLQDLHADYCPEVTENAFKVPFEALESLSLNRCAVTSKIFPHLAKCAPKITSLSLVGTPLTDNKADAKALSHIPLEFIDVSHTALSATTLNALNDTLVKLKAEECPKIFDKSFRKFPNLKFLHLTGMNGDIERRYEMKKDLKASAAEETTIEV